jgi:hypothetical protein
MFFRRWIPLVVLLSLAAATPTPAQVSEKVQNAYSLRNVGLARIEARNLTDARDQFEELADLYPNEALGWANLGLIDLRGGDASAGLKNVQRARQLAPDRADIALLEVNVLQGLDRLDDALAAADAALQKHQDDPKLLFARASILESKRDKSLDPELLATWRRLHQREPANVYPILEMLVLGPKLEDWDATKEGVAAFREHYYQIPERVDEALNDLLLAANGDAAAIKKSKTRGLIVRNVVRASRRFKRDSEELRLPETLGGGEEIVEFALPELVAARDAIATGNAIDLLRSNSFRAEVGPPLGLLAPMTGDLNADGAPEIVVWAGYQQLVPVIFRRSGRGWNFEQTLGAPLPAPAESAAVWSSLADLDNDTDLDLLALVRSDDKASLWVYANDASGALTLGSSATHAFAGSVADALLLGDFDHDGDLDLLFFVEAESGRWTARLLVNNLDGSFAEKELRVESLKNAPLSLVALDFADDVALDFAARTSTGLFAFQNALDGGFPTLLRAPLESAGPARAGLGDFRHDGWVEAIFSGGGGSALINDKGKLGLKRGLLAEKGDLALVAGDFDNDGWIDLVAEDGAGGLQLRFNRGGELWADKLNVARGERAPAAADLDGDGDLDVIALEDTDHAVLFHENKGGNANRWLTVRLRGARTNDQKNNYFGMGSSLEVKAGVSYQRTFVTDDATHFGLGQRRSADAIRIVWTNGSPQAILYPDANQVVNVDQVILGSCPSLYCWDGEKFQFVTDVLWRSALGMFIMKDIYGHNATSDDHFLLPQEVMVPKNGRYELRFVMDFWETAYLDKLKLLAVDHPADGADIRVNETCVAPPYPDFRLYRVNERVGLAQATDFQGADHRAALASRDKNYVINFERSPYQGVATPHDLILTAERWPATPEEPFHLFLNGWLYPTDASINVALAQTSLYDAAPPVVEARGADGVWREVAWPGFPAGKYKTIAVDLTGKLPPDVEAVRVSTNFLIYWDEAFFAGDCDASAAKTCEVPLASADLRWRGGHRMFWENGLGPLLFDYDDVEAAPRWVGQTGLYTRFGDVAAMLVARDDRYVVTGSGEEIALSFDAEALPPLPDGWRRDFVIFTDGWLKDANLNSLTGQTVEPLPYTGMEGFPPQKENDDPAWRAFIQETLTRPRGTEEFRQALQEID